MSGIQRLADSVKTSAQVLANETQRLLQVERRYEYLRTLSPVEFHALWAGSITGENTFDSLVDRAIEKRSLKCK